MSCQEYLVDLIDGDIVFNSCGPFNDSSFVNMMQLCIIDMQSSLAWCYIEHSNDRGRANKNQISNSLKLPGGDFSEF